MVAVGPGGAVRVALPRHDQVIRSRDAAIRGIAFYERGLARLEDRWVGTGEPGDRFRDDDHVYANDLDLFGRGSLFELLSLARTRSGEETLARWLTSRAECPRDSGASGGRRGAPLGAGSSGAARAGRSRRPRGRADRSPPRLGRVADVAAPCARGVHLALHRGRARRDPVAAITADVVGPGHCRGVASAGVQPAA